MNNRVLTVILLIGVQLLSAQSFESSLPPNSFADVFNFTELNNPDLYNYGFNTAWLNARDTVSWMDFRIVHKQSRNRYMRPWDSRGMYKTGIMFSGQKTLSKNQTFYGYIVYNMDYSADMNKAIVLTPYRLSPFVIADSTAGDFIWYGPTVFASYSNHLMKDLWWGASLRYGIYRGLKEVYSMPELNRVDIRVGLDVVYRFNSKLNVGVSFRPYRVNNLIKIVKQPDGRYPAIFRYRGEFEYSKVIGGNDRTEIFEGYDLSVQSGLSFGRLKGVVNLGYFYQWYETFDGTATHIYDGYYQGQHYYFNTAWKYRFGSEKGNFVYLDLRYRFIEDWAKEPKRGYLIYEANYNRLYSNLGFSHLLTKFYGWGVDFKQYYNYPERVDYLARINRRGFMIDNEIAVKMKYERYDEYYFEFGAIYHWYSENEVWRYFGDLSGPGFLFNLDYPINDDSVFIIRGKMYQIGRAGNNNYYLTFHIGINQKL